RGAGRTAGASARAGRTCCILGRSPVSRRAQAVVTAASGGKVRSASLCSGTRRPSILRSARWPPTRRLNDCSGARAFLSSSLTCPALPGARRPGCWRTGDGCVVELLVNVDEDGVVFDLAGVNRDGAAGKHADGLAGGQVVAGCVGGADQRVVVLQGALVQGLLLVSAGVVDRPDIVIIEPDEAD